MTVRRIIPDTYTTYKDGSLGVVAPSLANVEAKIGWAKGGKVGQVYTFSGPSAKDDAKLVFKGGALLEHCISAFDAGSTTIHAVRIGDPTQAAIALKNTDDTDAVGIRLADAGTPGNNHYVTLEREEAYGEVYLTLVIEDRNTDPALLRTYDVHALAANVNAALIDAINADGVYEASEMDGVAVPLAAVSEATALSGGTDGSAPTNAHYLAGLEATVGKTEVAWIHAIGANTLSLWTAILTHCDEMATDYRAERFAILETPAFMTSYEQGTSGYLGDLQTYVDTIVSMMATVADRNAVVFAGGAKFLDTDGAEITLPVTAATGGTMAGLEVQKSLINKKVDGVLSLIPEFTPGQMQSLIQARVNCLRFKPGRGYVIAHSLTAAASGSDYTRVNDLRAVYYGAKAAREAAEPYVGEENDKEGEGLRKLESAMARPLEVMRDAGQIDDFELSAVSTATDRLLGDVHVSLGMQPRRAMEMIYTTVTLK